MSILEDSTAEQHVRRVRDSAAFVPYFATVVIVVGVGSLVLLGWFGLDKWTTFNEQADKSHLAAVKMGMLVGVILGGGTALGLTSICYGLWLLFRRRNDLLVLRLWDELADLRSTR
ncbi:MAG: hypothetical protein ACKVT0_01335 [Planctomycetaceae bacterium]